MTQPGAGPPPPPGDPAALAAWLGLEDRPGVPEPSFKCPRCSRVSYHPTDLAEGYCGACHDWTGPRA